ncbi:MAG: hypothetical protein LKF63_08170 [Solobacterium sp.]|jgi:hypothetical protein|nr:hypothetical protein [Solobacterium sp.]MCH4227802.1 hypothetical protein [Solobacterium sp.]MCH4283306.1 hypothetical protein [Solobacterium sp.]
MKKQNEVIIYIGRGDKLCYQLSSYAAKQHAPWVIVDSSEIVEDEELWESFEHLPFKKFPVVQINGRIMRYQPASVDELIKYIDQHQNIQLEGQI